MEIFNELVPIKNTCIGLGFFDGVHLGHKKLINMVVASAKENNSKSVIITFKASPAEIFYNSVEYLTTLEEKENFISKLGIDYIIELDFTKELMQCSAEEYLSMLHKYFNPKAIITGFNHTFGKDKIGNSEFLKRNEKKYNYKYIEVPPYMVNEKVVSSTIIRELLNHGKIDDANNMLGYKYSIKGTVVEGNKIGRTIGFPTANIIYPHKKVKIPFGVYSADVKIYNRTYSGMLNYGIKPTINNGENNPVAEVHIIGFNENIYNQNIEILLCNKIRDEKKFNSLEELKNQIKKDLSQC
ncbi:bifunctional riboflavin kinase/FAD synthetase [bacterium]|nr:bifunctional riboflavin kinase/FAD synthetase [bacterium]